MIPSSSPSGQQVREGPSSSARAAALCGAALLFATCGACAELPIAQQQFSYPAPQRGAVVSEHPLATKVGLEILAQGGNAVDAAVATALALSVVYPQAGSLGGGGFALWVPHGGGESLAFDFRETAPAALDAGDYLTDGEYQPLLSRRGALAVGVPGLPAGLWELADKLGKLPFQRLVEPAIRLARDGYLVDAWLAHHLRVPGLREQLQHSPAARRVYYPAGRPLSEGRLLVQAALAGTLEQLASRGPRGFYEGFVAQAIVSHLQSAGGLMTMADLRGYSPVWRTPIRGWFRGHEVISMPPPSSGGILMLQVLRMLDGFPLDAEREAARQPESESVSEQIGLNDLAVHWWIEAFRRAFADRAEHLGDPQFWSNPVEELLSAEWIAVRRVSIGARAGQGVQPMPREFARAPGSRSAESDETTHVSVLDSEGNAVSLTVTLNGFFGSGVMVGEIGVLLNNQMDDFSVLPGIPNEYGLVGSDANAIVAGKRPLSSMTPTVLREGGHTVRLVIGSPGGPRIITAVLQVILRMLVYGQSLADAIRAPRLHQQWRPATTDVESGWETDLLSGLERRGHHLQGMQPRSSVQAIWVGSDGEPVAVSDPRRGGVGGVVGAVLSTPVSPPADAQAVSASPR